MLEDARNELATQGFVVHAPLRSWVGKRLREHRERLEAGERAAVAVYGVPDVWPAATARPSLTRLRDALDAYAVLDIDLDDAVSPSLRAWLAHNTLSPG